MYTMGTNVFEWINQYKIGSENWYKVAHGNDIFVAVGDAGNIAYSTNGKNWISAIVGTNKWNSVRYYDNKFIATGNAVGGIGKMAYSSDGISWTEINVGTSDWLDITYCNGLWVAVGGMLNGFGRIAYSTDGIDWTIEAMGTNTDYWRGITVGIF